MSVSPHITWPIDLGWRSLMRFPDCRLSSTLCSTSSLFYFELNKCIGDDTKGAARRSPNYIRKTKKYVLWNAGYLSHYRNSMKNCFFTQNFTEIGQLAAELWPKTIFKMGPSAILNFTNFHIWSSDCHRVPNLHLCNKLHQNRPIFRWDMAILRFAISRPSAVLIFEI